MSHLPDVYKRSAMFREEKVHFSPSSFPISECIHFVWEALPQIVSC